MAMGEMLSLQLLLLFPEVSSSPEEQRMPQFGKEKGEVWLITENQQ